MTANPGKLLSCATGGRNCATFNQTGATAPATSAQQKNKPGLKSLADAVVKRNLERNQCATKGKNTRNFLPENDHQKLRKLLPVSVERIGTDAVPNCATFNKIIDGLHPCSLCGGNLFNEGSRGGYFCLACQKLPDGVEPVRVVKGITPRGKDYLCGDNPGWIPLTPSRQPVKRDATKRKPSPVALDWLRKHRQELRQAGWTGRELYRANKSKGICWCRLWDKPFLKVYLHSDGVIEFECVDGGRDCIQTAQPESFWDKNKKGYDND